MVDRWSSVSGTWQRWELVHVEREPEGLIVDALEVPGGAPARPARPITVSFLPRSEQDWDTSEAVGDQLAAWLERDDGMCDVYHQGSDPYGFLALFQGSESLVLATVGEG